MEEKIGDKTEVKKEIQAKIIGPEGSAGNGNGKVTEEELFNVLKIVSPGTNFRSALDGALKAGKGALIVVENEQVLPLLDGGFRINCRFTPQRLIELTKMDGAIVISGDLKRINYANVLLTPSSKIKTNETGTRHKAAERTSKETGTLVIAISERKHDITLFYKNVKHPIRGAEMIFRKATEHIQLLEKQRELFDSNIEKLNCLELKNHPSLHQGIQVIQKGRLIQKIGEELKKNIIELGNEGTILKTRLKEIITGVEKETNLVIKDYTKLDLKKSRVLLESLTYDEILDSDNILRVLAYEEAKNNPVKGWRILSKTSLEDADIAKVIKATSTLGKAIHSNIDFYSGILEKDKIAPFREEIERIKMNTI